MPNIPQYSSVFPISLANTHIKSHLSPTFQQSRCVRQEKDPNLWEAAVVISSVVVKVQCSEEHGGGHGGYS